MITIEQFVQREIDCCMSGIVATLASGQGNVKSRCELAPLVEQAAELCYPIPDYEEAARQAGWQISHDGNIFVNADGNYCEDPIIPSPLDACGWQNLCAAECIEPYEWDVYEHWSVSQWLAEKLIAAGERVDCDFAGLNVWARTTTGQAISMDGCMQRIYSAAMCGGDEMAVQS